MGVEQAAALPVAPNGLVELPSDAQPEEQPYGAVRPVS